MRPIMSSMAWTDWARRRKSRSILAVSRGDSGGRPRSQRGGVALGVANAGERGAAGPGNAARSRGAGTDGAGGGDGGGARVERGPAPGAPGVEVAARARLT